MTYKFDYKDRADNPVNTFTNGEEILIKDVVRGEPLEAVYIGPWPPLKGFHAVAHNSRAEIKGGNLIYKKPAKPQVGDLLEHEDIEIGMVLRSGPRGLATWLVIGLMDDDRVECVECDLKGKPVSSRKYVWQKVNWVLVAEGVEVPEIEPEPEIACPTWAGERMVVQGRSLPVVTTSGLGWRIQSDVVCERSDGTKIVFFLRDTEMATSRTGISLDDAQCLTNLWELMGRSTDSTGNKAS